MPSRVIKSQNSSGGDNNNIVAKAGPVAVNTTTAPATPKVTLITGADNGGLGALNNQGQGGNLELCAGGGVGTQAGGSLTLSVVGGRVDAVDAQGNPTDSNNVVLSASTAANRDAGLVLTPNTVVGNRSNNNNGGTVDVTIGNGASSTVTIPGNLSFSGQILPIPHHLAFATSQHAGANTGQFPLATLANIDSQHAFVRRQLVALVNMPANTATNGPHTAFNAILYNRVFGSALTAAATGATAQNAAATLTAVKEVTVQGAGVAAGNGGLAVPTNAPGVYVFRIIGGQDAIRTITLPAANTLAANTVIVFTFASNYASGNAFVAAAGGNAAVAAQTLTIQTQGQLDDNSLATNFTNITGTTAGSVGMTEKLNVSTTTSKAGNTNQTLVYTPIAAGNPTIPVGFIMCTVNAQAAPAWHISAAANLGTGTFTFA